MLKFNNTSKQISPCIVAKARFALDNQRNQPTNQKRCSKEYWDNVIDTLCKNDPTLKTNIVSAKEMYNQLIPLK